MLLLTISLIILILFVRYYLAQYGRMGRFVNKIPGPATVPLLGNMHSFQTVNAETIWTYIRALTKEYYPIFRVWSFTTPSVNVYHPDDMETILSSTKFTQKSLIYQLLHPWFKEGLLTSSGSKWQMRRKILTPAFHFNVLQQFLEVFIEESERMIAELKEENGPVVKDLLPLASERTLNAICETAMGTSLKGRGKFQHKYRKAVYDMAHVLLYRLVRPWLHTYLAFNLTYAGWKQRSILKILHGFTKKIIQERKHYHELTGGKYLSGFDDNQNNYTLADEDVGIRKKRLAMLDLLIAAYRKNQIDDEGIREEVDTFMFEGHDTTAIAICFTVMLLAEHKEIQAKARAEVDALLEECNGKLTMSVLQKLPFLERCIKESLRLYPSVHFISRQIHEDLQLRDYLIPAGTLAHLHIIDTHRDPNFWPNPDVFDPDRFLPENIQRRHSYAYVPFSAGPRNCIGQRFAMLELKTILLYILHNFNLEPVDYLKDLRVTADLVIRPAHPIRTRFIPIN